MTATDAVVVFGAGLHLGFFLGLLVRARLRERD